MQIDVYQDLICPWCLIGRKRFGAALEARPDAPVTVVPRPFQLNPSMPQSGMDRQAYLSAKFGGPDRAARIYGMIEETASKEGIRLNLSKVQRTPNTVGAHRIVERAIRDGAPSMDLSQALLGAYFFEGEDIGVPEVLADVAEEFGYSRSETLAYLASNEDAAEVRAADAQARQIGVQAVPCFVFDRRYAVAGAQEPEAFFPMLDMASTEEPGAGP